MVRSQAGKAQRPPCRYRIARRWARLHWRGWRAATGAPRAPRAPPPLAGRAPDIEALAPAGGDKAAQAGIASQPAGRLAAQRHATIELGGALGVLDQRVVIADHAD